MHIFKQIDQFNQEEKYLIDYSNLQTNFFKYQKKFADLKDVNLISKKKFRGIPILIPINNNCFEIAKPYFHLNLNIIKKIFGVKKKFYIGIKNFISLGNVFGSDAKPKKKYNTILKKITQFNLKSIKKINQLAGTKKIIAFQTRNIPHLGHEKIINYFLKKKFIVIINPLIGPKKNGDIKSEYLIKIYKFLIKKKYQKKNIKIIPLICNMFYGGPREAMHHAGIREQIGFTNFIIGRDHAGAEKIYNPLQAFKDAKTNKKYFKIKIEPIMGSYFCEKCKKVVLVKNKFNNHKKYLKDISGSNFRKCLNSKKIYQFANKEMQQEIIKKYKMEIFY